MLKLIGTVLIRLFHASSTSLGCVSKALFAVMAALYANDSPTEKRRLMAK